MIDTHRRAAEAARLAMPTIAGAIAAALNAELTAMRTAGSAPGVREQRRTERLEQAVMNACIAVGAALDRLEQVKTTAGEPGARVALEKAARALRRAMEQRQKETDHANR